MIVMVSLLLACAPRATNRVKDEKVQTSKAPALFSTCIEARVAIDIVPRHATGTWKGSSHLIRTTAVGTQTAQTPTNFKKVLTQI
jgi:hypothetical protein